MKCENLTRKGYIACQTHIGISYSACAVIQKVFVAKKISHLPRVRKLNKQNITIFSNLLRTTQNFEREDFAHNHFNPKITQFKVQHFLHAKNESVSLQD